MARVIRARPPRPALVRTRVPSGPPAVPRSGLRPRGASVVALAAVAALALALVAATSLALAGLQLQPGGVRSDGPRSDPRTPGDAGLTATPTTLLWSAAVPSASAPASHHRLAGPVRRAAVTRPVTPVRRHALGSRGAVRTRAQRWFARRNLEGG